MEVWGAEKVWGCCGGVEGVMEVNGVLMMCKGAVKVLGYCGAVRVL